jgi:hypothetical protein
VFFWVWCELKWYAILVSHEPIFSTLVGLSAAYTFANYCFSVLHTKIGFSFLVLKWCFLWSGNQLQCAHRHHSTFYRWGTHMFGWTNPVYEELLYLDRQLYIEYELEVSLPLIWILDHNIIPPELLGRRSSTSSWRSPCPRHRRDLSNILGEDDLGGGLVVGSPYLGLTLPRLQAWCCPKYRPPAPVSNAKFGCCDH